MLISSTTSSFETHFDWCCKMKYVFTEFYPPPPPTYHNMISCILVQYSMYHHILYFILASSFFEYRMPFHALHMPPYLNTPMHIMTIANLSTYPLFFFSPSCLLTLFSGWQKRGWWDFKNGHNSQINWNVDRTEHLVK